MKNALRLFGIVLACGFLAGCFIRPAASSTDVIPGAHIEQCKSLCASANMTVQSIVVISDRTGCVCGKAQSAAAAASAGGVAVVLQRTTPKR